LLKHVPNLLVQTVPRHLRLDSMIKRLVPGALPVLAASRVVSQKTCPLQLPRHFGSSGSRSDREAILAKAYLREYMKAKKEGNVQGAMRYLEKATVAAEYVHVNLPSKGDSRHLLPLAAIVPDFSYDESSPRWVLPISVDARQEERMPVPEPVPEEGFPKPIILP